MKNKLFENLDSLGFSASFICAIHCAAMPILLSTVSACNFGFLANPLFEIAMISISIIIGFSSLLPSYRHHENIMPIATLFMGFSFIFSGHFLVSTAYEPLITPVGAFIVAFAHLINIKFSKKYHICSDSH